MKNVIAFGDCIPRGVISLDSVKTKKIDRSDGIIGEIMHITHTNISNHCIRRSGLCRSGCNKFPNEEKANPNNSVIHQVLNTDLSDYDTVIIFMSSNDWGLNAPFGAITSTNDCTYCGALNKLFSYLSQLNKKIFCVTCLYRSSYGNKYTRNAWKCINKYGYSLNLFCDTFIQKCKDYEFPVLDLRQYKDINVDTYKTTLLDSLHPTLDSARNLGKFIGDWILTQNYIKY